VTEITDGVELRRARRAVFSNPVLLGIPVLLFMLVFFIYPALSMFAQGFIDVPQGASVWSNYVWMIEQESNVRIFVRTLTTSLWVTFCCVVVGYPVAYAMTIATVRWRLLILGVILVPYWTSFIVRNFAWIVILQDNGVLNQIVGFFGIGRLSLLGTTTAVMIGMTQMLLPFVVLPVYTTMTGIDPNLVRAAHSLGARPIVAFLTVFFPLSLPGVAAGAMLVFIIGLGFYVTPAMLGSPSNAMLSQIIVTQVEQLLAWGRGSAMATGLLLTTLVILGLGALIGRALTVRSARG
jgi:putative spermidine/putrescine transport system permease protein